MRPALRGHRGDEPDPGRQPVAGRRLAEAGRAAGPPRRVRPPAAVARRPVRGTGRADLDQPFGHGVGVVGRVQGDVVRLDGDGRRSRPRSGRGSPVPGRRTRTGPARRRPASAAAARGAARRRASPRAATGWRAVTEDGGGQPPARAQRPPDRGAAGDRIGQQHQRHPGEDRVERRPRRRADGLDVGGGEPQARMAVGREPRGRGGRDHGLGQVHADHRAGRGRPPSRARRWCRRSRSRRRGSALRAAGAASRAPRRPAAGRARPAGRRGGSSRARPAPRT